MQAEIVKEIQELTTQLGNLVVGLEPKIGADWDAMEKLLAAILEDYNNTELPVKKMLRKYHISTARFQELKKLWNIPSKGRHPHTEKQSKSGASKPQNNKSVNNSASAPQKPEPQVIFIIPIEFQFSSETVAKLLVQRIAEIIEDACNG